MRTMEKKMYILRTDRPGKVVARTKIQKLKQGISDNILMSTSGYSALKGDIYEELPSDEQPSDDHKISVVSVEDDTRELEVATADLTKLTDAEANLLLPVPTSKERFDIFASRNILEKAVASKLEDEVTVKLKAYTQKGILKYKGKIEGKKGIYFGVLLDRKFGDSDGTIQGKRYFQAKKDYGVFESINNLKFEEGTNRSKINREQAIEVKEKISGSAKKVSMLKELDSHFNLKIGMRVVAFGSDEKDVERVLRGIIRFIGHTDNDKDIMFGIELDTPDGPGDGLYKGERAFKCKKYHAIFTTADSIMKEEDYNVGSADSFVVLTHADEHSEQGTKTRLKQDIEVPKRNTVLENDKLVQNFQFENRHGELLRKSLAQMRSEDLAKTVQENPVKMEPKTRSAPLFDHKTKTQQNITNILQNGPKSLPFEENHFANAEKRREGIEKSFLDNYKLQEKNKDRKSKSDEHVNNMSQFDYHLPSYEESIHLYSDLLPESYQTYGRNFKKPQFERDYDISLQVDSVVEVNVNDVPHYGVIRWKGVPDGLQMSEPIVGLELEEPYEFGTDGSFRGKRYFSCPAGRGFFVKLSNCKRDARFSHSLSPRVQPIMEQVVQDLPGIYLPVEKSEDIPIGQMCGIQGHHNSCYLDSTLFAMFAFSVVFDVVLHREKRNNDIKEYDEVRRVLKDTIVNPLRSKGFVNAGSVLQLRKWLDRLGSVQGFMNEEKDPEEFLTLLFRDVLKVDHFITLRTENDTIQRTHFYQIWVDKDEDNPLPSLQYLIEQSFLTGNLRLEEVPSVFIVQLPRFGMQKIYKRIRLNSHLDISKVMSSAMYNCLICEKKASISCRECCHSFGWASPFVYFCNSCNRTVHQQTSRKYHQTKQLKTSDSVDNDPEMHTLELFAIVCIKTSHYVTFAKCGTEPNEKWVFFDSMADRRGGQNGQNVPEVVECPEVSQWFNEKSLKFTESDSKNTPEKILRLFEDASLCLYRSNELSIYR